MGFLYSNKGYPGTSLLYIIVRILLGALWQPVHKYRALVLEILSVVKHFLPCDHYCIQNAGKRQPSTNTYRRLTEIIVLNFLSFRLQTVIVWNMTSNQSMGYLYKKHINSHPYIYARALITAPPSSAADLRHPLCDMILRSRMAWLHRFTCIFNTLPGALERALKLRYHVPVSSQMSHVLAVKDFCALAWE